MRPQIIATLTSLLLLPTPAVWASISPNSNSLQIAQQSPDSSQPNDLRDEYQEEIDKYTQAIKQEPDNPEHYSNRAYIYLLREDYPNALADYTKAIKLAPDRAEESYIDTKADYYLKRAEFYSEIKDYPNALADYTKAIELDTAVLARLYAYYGRGNVYYAMQQYQKAVEDYTEAIKLQPDAPVPYHNRAYAYGQLQNYPDAIADLEKAAQLYKEQDNPEAYEQVQKDLQELRKLQ